MLHDDLIDSLAGIAPGSALDALRARRPEARSQAQASHAALFAPEDFGSFDAVSRLAVAYFVAGLHQSPAPVDFYATSLRQAGAEPALFAAIDTALEAAVTQGPYGSYPPGPLSAEDAAGLVYAVAPELRPALGPVLAAGLEHAHMLVLHPRDAAGAHLQALLDAGWQTPAIVTLSQLVAFLTFQIRVVHGLATLAAQS